MLSITIEESLGLANIALLRQLRYLVLREPLGLPYEETLFPGDEYPQTRHVVAVLDGQPVGCLTLMPPQPIQNEDRPLLVAPHLKIPQIKSPQLELEWAWVQLRGMAVLGELEGQGIGSRLQIRRAHV